MKTNPIARHLLRIRFVLLCAAIVTLLGLEYYWSKAFATRMGCTTVVQSGLAVAPNLDFGDLMSAPR